MKEILEKIDKKELLFVLIMAFVLILATTAPTIYGYLVKPSDKFFPAIHSAGAGDFSVYYSYIDQAKEGNLLFSDLFTSEEHSPFIFNPFWLIVGLGARMFSLPSILAYHIARILLIIIFSLILYFLISYFIAQEKIRRYCFFFMIIASGLGGFLAPVIRSVFNNQVTLSIYPMDLWVSEAFTFFTLYHSPHFIMATILIIVSLFLMYFSFIKKKWIYAVISGLAANFLIFFHPFHLPTLLVVPVAYIFAKSLRDWNFYWDYIKKYVVFIILILPSVIYHFLILFYNPVAAARAEGNTCLTPVWWVTLISYGLILPLALLGIIKKRKSNSLLFIIVWTASQFVLIYSPLTFQRRLTHGLQIPLSLLAFFGLFALYKFFSKKFDLRKIIYEPVIIMLMILFFGFSNLYFLAEDFIFYSDSQYREVPEYIYLDAEYKDSYDWLKENTDKNSLLLGDDRNSNFVTGFSLRRTYVSHWAETVNFFRKKDNLIKFFNSQTEEGWRRDFLEEEKIDYVYYTPFEKRHGDYNPANSEFLNKVYEKEKVVIYEFTR